MEGAHRSRAAGFEQEEMSFIGVDGQSEASEGIRDGGQKGIKRLNADVYLIPWETKENHSVVCIGYKKVEGSCQNEGLGRSRPETGRGEGPSLGGLLERSLRDQRFYPLLSPLMSDRRDTTKPKSRRAHRSPVWTDDQW